MENNYYNIVLMSPLPPPVGGIGTWTMRYMNVCNKYGISIINVDEKISGREVFGKKSKRNIFKEIKRCFLIWKNLKNTLKQNKDYQIVHCAIPALYTSILRELVSLKVAHKYKRKFVVHFRSTTPISINKNLSLFLFKKILNKSDAIITINSQSYKHCLNFLNDKNKLFLVENFINNDVFDYHKKYNETLKNIFYSGGVTIEKGAKILLDVAKALPNYNFYLAGKVDDEIKQYSENLKINNVTFLGVLNQDQIKKEYLNNDLFIFPTFYPNEAFSNSLLEAMSFAMPCIATEWAANKDMLNNETYIVPIKSSEKIIDCIEKLKDQDIREELGKANKERVIKNYSEKIILNKYIDVYKSLLVNK